MKQSVIGRAASYAGVAVDLRKIKRATNDTVKANARHHLAERMGKLRGLPQKIGQMMSMSDNDSQADEFRYLSDQAEPIAFSLVRQTLEQAWGVPLESVIKQIDENGKAASLGQVHRAVLLTGEEVAIKVAYPGIQEAVNSDLKMLGWLSAPVGDLRRGFNLADYRSEIVRDLDEELNYQLEIEHQSRFAKQYPRQTEVIVPRTYPEWSRQNVLVTQWEDGSTIEEVAHWPEKDREELGRRLLRLFLTSLFDHGFVHGDPNPGNYRFRNLPEYGPQIVLYDYGSMAQFSKNDRMILLKLIVDTTARRGNPLSHLTALGFSSELLEPIQGKLPAVCSLLFEPFASPLKFDLQRWNRSSRMDDTLDNDRWNFRMAGPAKLILIMRAFKGVLYYLEKLQTPVSWERLLHPILLRYANELATLSLPDIKATKGDFSGMAKHLKIEVFRDGSRKVALTLGSSAIEDLESIMDEEVLANVKERGIDLDQIVRDVRRSGYAPAHIFTLEDPEQNKRVTVWIE